MIRFIVWWIRVALTICTVPVSLFPRFVIAKAGLVTLPVAVASVSGVGVVFIVVMCLTVLWLFARPLLVMNLTRGKTEAI